MWQLEVNVGLYLSDLQVFRNPSWLAMSGWSDNPRVGLKWELGVDNGLYLSDMRVLRGLAWLAMLRWSDNPRVGPQVAV